ncbi:SRPBCC family protein [Mycolicibacterium elephantis]|uniref:SRPBCC family protein n=1 Tax=Mycolicibacterium elephantis TaxID=81858 RepID=UPI0006296917|nr:SRPBCC family protein [Mycolicibacterium elephantis]KKW65823.1 hypothetical protein AAV95_04730 [Mycolicibacterium elephantis]OBB16470.1 hypothetical protein A5762_02390 [Mycolicibacterium elephantis]OBE94922.1 hypothetical protein A5776_21500 [Mycolicibacterium elephantis]
MQLQNEFVVDTGIGHAWEILTDIERIAPCLPGVALEGRDGEAYLATVKVKVGPIGANFMGSARFTAKDAAARCATVSAVGKDPRGTATAAAKVRFRLQDTGPDQTRVLVDTDLDISGRIAQFGRGAIADVSSRLLDQFVENLSAQVLGRPSGAAGAHPADEGAVDSSVPGRSREQAEPSSGDLDVFSLIVAELKDRYGQALIGAIGGLVLSWILFGRKPSR